LLRLAVNITERRWMIFSLDAECVWRKVNERAYKILIGFPVFRLYICCMNKTVTLKLLHLPNSKLCHSTGGCFNKAIYVTVLILLLKFRAIYNSRGIGKCYLGAFKTCGVLITSPRPSFSLCSWHNSTTTEGILIKLIVRKRTHVCPHIRIFVSIRPKLICHFTWHVFALMGVSPCIRAYTGTKHIVKSLWLSN
jgi:hypothetical protein